MKCGVLSIFYSVRLMLLLFWCCCFLSIFFINVGLMICFWLLCWIVFSIVNILLVWLVLIRMMLKCWWKSYVSFLLRWCFILVCYWSFLLVFCVNKVFVLFGKMICVKCIFCMLIVMSGRWLFSYLKNGWKCIWCCRCCL